MLFCPLKILPNSAILHYKNDKQEIIRIFKGQKSINQGFKSNARNDKIKNFLGISDFGRLLCLYCISYSSQRTRLEAVLSSC